MESIQQRAQSIWQKSKKPNFPILTEAVAADVCVIGSGISGLTTAYYLLKEGRTVIIIDRERYLGEHESGLTSAHLSNALDDRYSNLHRLHGEQGVRLAAESHTRAIDEIERICREEAILCDFERVPGYLFLSPDREIDYLRDELRAARAAGLAGVELLERSPISLFDTGPCLKFANQGQFHPVKYLAGLALAVQRAGGRIFFQTAATEIEGGHPARVHTTLGHQILCEDIVVATNVPFNDKLIMQTKNAAYRSYLVGIEIPWGHLPPCLLWDTATPYHYVRLVRDNDTLKDTLIVGGADHRVGHDHDPEHRYGELAEWAAARLTLDGPVTGRWSGQIIEPVDGMAYIGRNPNDADNVYIVTGDSGNGLTHGTIAGMVLRDLILNRENPWTDLYDPARVNFGGVGTYLKEVYSSTLPYSDWLKGGDVDSIDDIAPGEGAVIRDGLRKVAVYRDTYGTPYAMSASCTHLGGVVRWNSSEKTWDCPCHGSRFSRYGEVINAPAPSNLKPTDLPGTHRDEPISPPPPAVRAGEWPAFAP